MRACCTQAYTVATELQYILQVLRMLKTNRSSKFQKCRANVSVHTLSIQQIVVPWVQIGTAGHSENSTVSSGTAQAVRFMADYQFGHLLIFTPWLFVAGSLFSPSGGHTGAYFSPRPKAK